MAGLTVVPNEDGTIEITQSGGIPVTYDADDIDRCGLSLSEKRFLRGQLRYAVPWPVACTTGGPGGGPGEVLGK